ncbi:MAG: superoxide dismutase [Candidatus Hydrogenedens sp.]|nr:superoxide dismutase [Candidatus Hydrogenedentota bacterium]NLF58198.1 superoxide dismutase [Candidatus Hydrogenedens sp.]
MSFKQPELPYDLGALAPFVSEEQMSFHYGKHHAAYFTNLNGLVDGKPESEQSLREVVLASQGPVFNNSAQAWNHSFFWHCLATGGGGAPKGAVKELIERDFGGFDKFKEDFSTAAAKLFGSGWAWLAADASGKLEIMPLSNADTPLKHGKEPILTLDVWEHAYYIDYRNARPKFIEGFWDVVNWDFVNKNLTAPFQE